MGEAAVAAAPSAPVTPSPAVAPSGPTTTHASGLSVGPTTQIPDWATSFKDEGLRSQMSKFKDVESLANSYRNLEVKLSQSPPQDRTLVLPEKLEGDALKPIYQKLGMPSEAKEYDIPVDEKMPEFADWAKGTFHQNNLTKTQAKGLAEAYNQFVEAQHLNQQQKLIQANDQADMTLKQEWGPHYETNMNLTKAGVRALGLDANTLNALEALQGREKLFKTLQKIGVSVGESNFVDGNIAPGTNALTPEQANEQIQALMKDQKFQKKFNRGDVEALNQWNALNKAAFPGEKPIG